MSAFLGKIHYWLYNKIQVEEGILNEVFNLAILKGYDVSDLKSKGNLKFGEPENRALEEVIAQDNIHGWLQEKIASVESRLAFTVTTLKDENIITSEELNKTFELNGKKLGDNIIKEEYTLNEVFTLIYDNLLAGMPCDRVNEVVDMTSCKLTWKKNIDIHKQYWELVGGDVENFHRAIDSWIAGFLSSFSSFKYTVDGELFMIERS